MHFLEKINVAGNGGAQTIAPQSALPAITDPIVIDATSQPGYSGSPLIELSGVSAGAGVNGLTLYDAAHDCIHSGTGDDMILGGVGNDIVFAGSGSDVLIGGDGYDWLDAGSGCDILIGGRDSDLLQGRGGDDILISGYTFLDNDIAALNLLRNEWTSDHSYQERVLNLSGQGDGQGENGNTYLIMGGQDGNIFDDGSVDLVFGQSGMDWFFYSCEDIDDQNLNEIFANDLGELLND